MGDLARIVLRQSRAQVAGNTDVEMLGIETFKNVNVLHGAAPLCQKGYSVGLTLDRACSLRYDSACLAEAGATVFMNSPPSPFGLRRGSLRSLRYDRPRGGLPSRSSRSERRLVEPGGIEPPTSCMPCKRSPS